MTKELIEGNVAIAEAAVRAGLEAYFGYPITPQTEVLEHLSRRMPEEGRVFLQAESELASINMVYGAASTGVRVMSSSSSPGISLMQEGLSYIACSEVPAVLVNIMRGGPGLGAAAAHASRIPPGHPEGYLEVFAQLYSDLADQISARIVGGKANPLSLTVPTVADGVDGVRFITRAVDSSQAGGAWLRC